MGIDRHRFSGWITKKFESADAPTPTAARPFVESPGCAAWFGLEPLESRALYSSTLLPLVPAAPAAITVQNSPGPTWLNGTAFSADSRALWVWSDETFAMLDNAGGQRQAVLDFLAAKRVTTVYLFVGNENPLWSMAPAKYLETHTAQYESLIADLKGQGLAVFALIGGSGLDSHIGPGGRVEQVFQSVLTYNTAHPDFNQRFDGVNLDIEPWANVPGWHNQLDRQRDYLEMGLRLMRMKNQQDPGLKVGPATAHWFGNAAGDFIFPWASNPTGPSIKQLHEHVLDVYDYVSIQAYRDAKDYITSFVREEVQYGNRIGKPVVVGVETANNLVNNQNFYAEGESTMERVLAGVKKTYAKNRAFAGFALHDLGNYFQWASSVVGRYIFYNASAFDGSAAANGNDDKAIAADKSALLPGQAASFVNYTSYSKGINGIMVDIKNLPTKSRLSVKDFVFKVGNNNNPGKWSNAPKPISVTVRRGAGVGGSARVTILWADGAIQNKWLQVTVKASANTGLTFGDVFYFGSAVGDTGNSIGDARVTDADAQAVQSQARSAAAAIISRYDFNRDGRVDQADLDKAKNVIKNNKSLLSLIRTPQPAWMKKNRIA